MRDFKYPKSFPDNEEILFLQMLLSGRNDFPQLWQQWKNRTVFDRLDKATLKLIPFLYLRLKELSIPDDEIKMIKGIYKHTWYKNLLIMDTTKKVVSSFNEENIPVLLLKGVPLIVNVYKNTAARTVGDADILIDPGHVEKAVEIMNANDWEYIYQSPFSMNRTVDPVANPYNKELTFINRQNVSIDLHWRLFMFLFEENKEHPMSYDAVYQHAIDCDLRGAKCKMPCHEDMIIHIIVHGAEQTFERTIRWALDVASIIRNVSVDWKFLIERIKEFDVAVELNVAFSFLLKNNFVAVPESFMKELSELPLSKSKIKKYYKVTNGIELMFLGKLPYFWRAYRLYERKGNIFTSWYFFIDYACKMMGITSKKKIPAFIFEKYKKRISFIFNNQ